MIVLQLTISKAKRSRRTNTDDTVVWLIQQHEVTATRALSVKCAALKTDGLESCRLFWIRINDN